MKRPDDLGSGDRDEGTVERPTRRTGLDVDRRLCRNPVAFLGYGREERREWKTVAIFSGANMEWCVRHLGILARSR